LFVLRIIWYIMPIVNMTTLIATFLALIVLTAIKYFRKSNTAETISNFDNSVPHFLINCVIKI
jgi:Flp pilus assembly protein TadB